MKPITEIVTFSVIVLLMDRISESDNTVNYSYFFFGGGGEPLEPPEPPQGPLEFPPLLKVML